MGVWGWDIMSHSAELRGTAKTLLLFDDGDWCFKVDPDAGFEGLLTNPSKHTNKNGLIECEIEPPSTSPAWMPNSSPR